MASSAGPLAGAAALANRILDLVHRAQVHAWLVGAVGVAKGRQTRRGVEEDGRAHRVWP